MIPTEPNRNPDRLNLVMRSYDGKITACVEHSPAGQYVLWSDYVQLRERLVDSGFELAETMEVLHRGWNIDGMSVRPDHRMVAHTGFLTHARLLPN